MKPDAGSIGEMDPNWWSLSQWIQDWQYVMWFAPKYERRRAA